MNADELTQLAKEIADRCLKAGHFTFSQWREILVGIENGIVHGEASKQKALDHALELCMHAQDLRDKALTQNQLMYEKGVDEGKRRERKSWVDTLMPIIKQGET